MESDLQVPIRHEYTPPSADFTAHLKHYDSVTDCAKLKRTLLTHAYRDHGYRGTLDRMLVRDAVAQCLERAVSFLDPEYEFVLFDTFRTVETQRHVFADFCEQVQAQNPAFTTSAVIERARRFAHDPDNPDGWPVLPHNSGGAVDLSISCKGNLLDMGTRFDELSDRSETAFFESEHDPRTGISQAQWEQVRSNRRMLFHAMTKAGFINYHAEWWHYDLGDCVWAHCFKTDWYYDSMERLALT